MAADPERINPPYISWQTFHNFMDRLKDQVLPTRIDRSVLPKTMAGTLQRQLVSALRFMQLIDIDNSVTAKMRKLHQGWSNAERKDALEHVILEAYNEITTGLDLDSGTATQLFERFKTVAGVDGQVRQKCVRFFLAALQACDMTFSPHFLARGSGGNDKSGKRSPKKQDGASPKNKAAKTSSSENGDHSHHRKPPVADGMIAFDIPLGPGTGQAVHIQFPQNLREADRKMIDAVLSAYIARQGEG